MIILMDDIMKQTCINVIFIAICLVSLSACSQAKDYQYFMEHPKTIKPVYERCQTSADQGINNPQCQAAIRASQDVDALLEELQASPFAFGEKILRAQQQYAQLKQAERDAPTKKAALKVKQQATQSRQYIARLLTIVRISGE